MKNLLITTWLLLFITGILLIPGLLAGNKFLLWVHISLGFLGLALFIVYLIDHLSLHWRMLLFFNRQSTSGSMQLLMAFFCWLSGILLFLYGAGWPSIWSLIHLATSVIWLIIGYFHGFKK